jgi:membrane-associated phospholipid phosphatase
MTTRELVTYRITLFLSLITISIIQIDRPLAIFIDTHLTALHGPFGKILSGIEFLSEYTVSRYLIAALILAAALFLLIRDKSVRRAKIFFFMAAVVVSSRLVTATLKIIFDRSRPFVFLEDRSIPDFFSGGDSFPSGHATNYFSFFLPLIVLIPRYKWIWLILPTFIALQRVIVNEHYLSDVLAGILIASVMTLLFQGIFKMSPLKNSIPGSKS